MSSVIYNLPGQWLTLVTPIQMAPLHQYLLCQVVPLWSEKSICQHRTQSVQLLSVFWVTKLYSQLQDLRFSQHCFWEFRSPGIWSCVVRQRLPAIWRHQLPSTHQEPLTKQSSITLLNTRILHYSFLRTYQCFGEIQGRITCVQNFCRHLPTKVQHHNPEDHNTNKTHTLSVTKLLCYSTASMVQNNFIFL